MESILYDGNLSDSNTLLPPRKRLLAGFKKQNSNLDSDHPSTSNEKCIFDTRINDFMKFHLENPNLSLEEIVEESSRAAKEAVKVMVAARAVAEEKAVVAAKAMAEAKTALELVANISDEAYRQNRHLKKNKMKNQKKHLPIKVFSNKPANVENLKTDEELASSLHHIMNSSPRIIKNSENPNFKANKHKRVKSFPMELPRVTGNGHDESESETDSEYLIGEREVIGVSGNTSKSNENRNSGMNRGRMKQKKLPLSICSFRDLANTKEEIRSNGSLSNKASIVKNNVAPTMWNCKAFKASACVEPNKVMEP